MVTQANIDNGDGKVKKPKKVGVPARDKAMRGKDGLTPRERKFAEAYLTNGFNITAAARAAGHQCRSVASFHFSGRHQLDNPIVRKFIDRHLEAARMSSSEIIARLEEHAKANPADFFNHRWKLNKKVVRERGHLIKKLRVPSNGKPAEIELHDSQAALVRLGSTYGMFSDKVQHIGDPNQPITHEFIINVAAAEVEATGPKLIKDAVIDVGAEVKP